MKYFTPEKYLRLQARDTSAMDAADTDWEGAVADYERHLESIRPKLTESIRCLLDDYSLHDAEVFFMGRTGDNLVIALRLKTPPRNFLVLTYMLLETPNVMATNWPGENLSSRALWLVDEIDLGVNMQPSYGQSILFSNGWQVQLTFRDVEIVSVQAMLPEPVFRAERLAGV